jgi:hypothetical protein
MTTVTMAPCLGRSVAIAETQGERAWNEAMHNAKQQTDGLDRSEHAEAAPVRPRKPVEATEIVGWRRQADSAHRPAPGGAPG